MDNQHRKIKGYRDLSEEEIAVFNTIKEAAEDIGQLLESIQESPSKPDMRWHSIAKTHLQQGFMALTRSVAKPESF